MNCFIIIGYGKKQSYAGGKLRELDLNETYDLLIKPVFDDLGIPCYRAIDKNLSGSIDKLMLYEIKHADIALVDLSTLNANVMWELGVRHALKPHHTIMICEKEQMHNIPFDVNHFVIHQYAHSEEGIPYKEVERFRKHLTNVVKNVLAQDPQVTDSPVFTFLEAELADVKSERKQSFTGEPDKMEPSEKENSFAGIMDQAEEAKKNNEFKKALELYAKARVYAADHMALSDNLTFIIARQALCTYKLKQPTELDALIEAKMILEQLNPSQQRDTEVLGLKGAINKRLYEITGDMSCFDSSVRSYEEGFHIKQDYYNGINAAFMLYQKAASLKEQGAEDWMDVKLHADYITNQVLKNSKNLEASDRFGSMQDAIWILLTIAEAHHYRNDLPGMETYENKAEAMAVKTGDSFAISSYTEQKKKIDTILEKLN